MSSAKKIDLNAFSYSNSALITLLFFNFQDNVE